MCGITNRKCVGIRLLLIVSSLILCLSSTWADDDLPKEEPQRLIEGTRRVVARLTKVAAERTMDGEESKEDHDKLTEFYIRASAAAAQELPDDIAPKAFVLGIAIACDDTEFLAKLPVLGEMANQVESKDERAARLRNLGRPTIRGREDLTQHFLISAYLTALTGPTTAYAAGLAKEMKDANGSSGFSFIDLAADRAGIQFASEVLEKKMALSDLADRFETDDFMPSIDGFVEGVTLEEFRRQFGSTTDERYRSVVQEIDDRLKKLREATHQKQNQNDN